MNNQKLTAAQIKQFNFEKKCMAMASEYHSLMQSLVYAKINRDVARITKLNWDAMSILLQYTLVRGLYSTRVAADEIAAFNRGKQIYGA